MKNRRSAAPRALGGFTLVEMAVVFTIASFLLASALYVLAAQVDQRNFEETRRRLEQARELLLGFAIVNGRLPCPATATSTGDEAPAGGATACTTGYAGWLPARRIGFQQTDSSGYAVDAWGNRIRYAISTTTWGTTPFARYTKQHISGDPTATWLITTTPADLVICGSAIGISGITCNTAASVTNQSIVVAIVFSTGKNGATGGTGTDEAENLDGDALFVFHTPTPSGAAGGEFDDQFTWITVGELYGKLISAGVLP
jgi:type II secretory pathway pseudopilin PulG